MSRAQMSGFVLLRLGVQRVAGPNIASKDVAAVANTGLDLIDLVFKSQICSTDSIVLIIELKMHYVNWQNASRRESMKNHTKHTCNIGLLIKHLVAQTKS